jgi:Putative auto-transporter adhesin, head GIN domain
VAAKAKLNNMNNTRMPSYRLRSFALLLLVFPFILSSCHNFMGKRIKGNGNIKTEDHNVSGFKNIDCDASADVYITQGEPAGVKVEGDDNLLPYIEINQEGDRLVIREKSHVNLDPSDGLKIYVTSPEINSINASGAGDIVGQTKITSSDELRLRLSGAGDIRMEVNAPTVVCTLSGAGSAYLKGQAKNVEVELSGVGSTHCYDLQAENTKVDVSGVGSAEVFASVKLDATVNGVGSINYKGNATDVSQHANGVGSIHKE